MSNPYLSLLATAWRYARHERRRYVGVYVLFLVSGLFTALYPLFFGWFVDNIQKDGSRILYFSAVYAAGMLLLKLAEWIFHFPARIMERELAFSLSRNFLQEMFHQALYLPAGWHQENHSGATINRIRKAYEALKEFFQNGFMYFYAVSKLILSFGAMIYFSPVYGSIGAALGLLTIWVIFKFDVPYIRSLDEVNEKDHRITANLFDSLSNIFTVITLRLERSMERGLSGKIDDAWQPFRRSIRINEWKWFVAEMLVMGIYAVIAFGFAWQNYKPGTVFYIGTLVTLLGYVGQFTSGFQDIAWQYSQIVQYNTDVQTARSISQAFDTQHRPDQVAGLPGNWRQIHIRHLNFSHRETQITNPKPQHLGNLAFTLERGKRIALVGESGSGKSTLLKVMRGLYDPEPGVELYIDQQKQDWTMLNASITLFPQEPEIFENTLAYNITLGLPFGDKEIEAICETAHFLEVARQLPKGLESSIQEKGVNLSGGQKQRLALARGILAARDSQVVLLDEPTSSIDPRTEAKIYENLFEVFADKAIVSALHRLHLLRHFDYVYVMEQGKIVEEGTFEHLREHGKVFREMWKHQETTQPVLI
jgi:ATP-binding cassette, subfamily B, bacterial